MMNWGEYHEKLIGDGRNETVYRIIPTTPHGFRGRCQLVWASRTGETNFGEFASAEDAKAFAEKNNK